MSRTLTREQLDRSHDLVRAIAANDARAVRRLIDSGVDLEAPVYVKLDKWGFSTPLNYAISKNAAPPFVADFGSDLCGK